LGSETHTTLRWAAPWAPQRAHTITVCSSKGISVALQQDDGLERQGEIPPPTAFVLNLGVYAVNAWIHGLFLYFIHLECNCHSPRANLRQKGSLCTAHAEQDNGIFGKSKALMKIHVPPWNSVLPKRHNQPILELAPLAPCRPLPYGVPKVARQHGHTTAAVLESPTRGRGDLTPNALGSPDGGDLATSCPP
jgi:hypothetical protein